MYPLIDILRLQHPEDSEKSAVRAYGGKKLNELFNELCLLLVEYKSLKIKQLTRIFGVNPNSIKNWRGLNPKYRNGHPIPLWAFQKILELTNSRYGASHREVINTINHLQFGRTAKRVKAAKRLDENLARLCGAHAADGSLYGWKDRGPITARWDIGDLEKSNIKAVREWTHVLFGIKLPELMKGNMSYTWSNMQVFSRYLTQIFDFPIGKKTDIVKEPRILSGDDDRLLTPLSKEISARLRLEFAKEVLNFDGHSTLTGGIVSIGLGVNSPHLRKSITEIFSDYTISFKNYDKHKKTLTTSKLDAEKIHNLGVFRGKKRNKFEQILGN